MLPMFMVDGLVVDIIKVSARIRFSLMFKLNLPEFC
jgi:hypothetical protein